MKWDEFKALLIGLGPDTPLGRILHGFLELFKSMVGGGSGLCIAILLRVIPDLNGLQKQAYNLIMGEKVDMHLLWTALLALWVISVGLIVFKKKDA